MSKASDLLDKMNESSLSRIIHFITAGVSFAIVSAYRGYGTPNGWDREYPDISKQEAYKKDLEAHNNLKDDLKGHGFIEMKSGYEGVNEESFFIPNISYDAAFSLGKKYTQQSIIYKDDKRFDVVYTLNFTDGDGDHHKEHEVGMSFNSKLRPSKREGSKPEGKPIVTFDPQVLKYAYSQLKKGTKSHKGKKFAFTSESLEDFVLYERYTPGSVEVMIKKKFDFGYIKVV